MYRNLTMKRLIPLFTFFLFSLTIFSQNEVEQAFGNGIVNVVAKDSSFSVKFGARMQTQYAFEWEQNENDDYKTSNSDFLIRRARLKFDGFALSPKLEYKIEIGLSNRDIAGGNEYTGNTPRYLYDAVVKWNAYKNIELWAGQTKLPGNRERVVSSGDLQLVDRSLLNSRFNIDRDIGIQLRNTNQLGNEFLIRQLFALSQGEGRNVTSGNFGGKQYTARVEFLPFGEFEDYEEADLQEYESPKLAVGVTYDLNEDAVKTRSNMGEYMQVDENFHETDIETIFADAMLKYRGFSMLSEYAFRDADQEIARDENGIPTGDFVNTGNAFTIQTGYLFGNNFEAVTRYTSVDEDNSASLFRDTSQYTLGLSKYLAGHKLKIQTDFSVTDRHELLPNQLQYRIQVDVHL